MKIYRLTRDQLKNASATLVVSPLGNHYTLFHNKSETGKRVYIPLVPVEFLPQVPPKRFFVSVITVDLDNHVMLECGHRIEIPWFVKPKQGLPLGCKECIPREHLLDGHYRLITLPERDQSGNPLYLISRGDETSNEDTQLIIWDLPKEYGCDTRRHRVEGSARFLIRNKLHPVVVVNGPCRLINESVNTDKSCKTFIADFDGEFWTIQA